MHKYFLAFNFNTMKGQGKKAYSNVSKTSAQLK